MLIALGSTTVTSAGTPVPVATATNYVAQGSELRVHAILIQALPTNTGKVYVGLKGLTKATYSQVLCVLPPPTTNMYPVFMVEMESVPNFYDICMVYIDVDVNGEGVLTTVSRQ